MKQLIISLLILWLVTAVFALGIVDLYRNEPVKVSIPEMVHK